MSAQHTPGPWHIGKRAGAEHGAVYGPNGEEVALPLGFFMTEDEAKSNARLIAAAPELLEVLQQVEAMLSDYPDAKRGNSKVHFLIRASRAAIAKATQP